jgi:GMP synthase-like glutamine amidotransferase
VPAQSVLVLDNALDHGFYRPVEHWTRLLGFKPESVYVPTAKELPEPGRHRHVIISGSEDTITALPAWAQKEADWIRRAADAGARILGSCWGHQLIAIALAGPGTVRRSPHPEFGWFQIEVIDDDGLLPKGSFDTFCSHFDEVVPDCHPDLKVLARTPACPVHAFRFGHLPVWGIQAHPEVEPAVGRAFIQGGIEKWPEDRGILEAALTTPVRDSQIGRDLVRNFLAF